MFAISFSGPQEGLSYLVKLIAQLPPPALKTPPLTLFDDVVNGILCKYVNDCFARHHVDRDTYPAIRKGVLHVLAVQFVATVAVVRSQSTLSAAARAGSVAAHALTQGPEIAVVLLDVGRHVIVIKCFAIGGVGRHGEESRSQKREAETHSGRVNR